MIDILKSRPQSHLCLEYFISTNVLSLAGTKRPGYRYIEKRFRANNAPRQLCLVSWYLVYLINLKTVLAPKKILSSQLFNVYQELLLTSEDDWEVRG